MGVFEVVPKFGEWCGSDPVPDDGYAHIFNKARDERRGALNDEFHKVKTFDLRGVKSDGRDKDQWLGPDIFGKMNKLMILLKLHPSHSQCLSAISYHITI